jgi:hypothetical protein
VEYDEVTIDEELYELEVLDGEVVQQSTELTPAHSTGRSLVWGSAPVLQTAAVAATGFVAGAATFALLRRYAMRARDAELLADRSGSRGGPLPLRRGATYLVQVRQIVPPQ